MWPEPGNRITLRIERSTSDTTQMPTGSDFGACFFFVAALARVWASTDNYAPRSGERGYVCYAEANSSDSSSTVPDNRKQARRPTAVN